MTTVKITDLNEITSPGSNDVLPIVDVANDITKKVKVSNLLGGVSGLPSGGTTGQALVKNSNTNGDVTWGSVQPLSTSLTNIDGLAGSSGILSKTGASTWTLDTTAYAPLASPTFTGTPAAPTAAADTNTTQIATTAYVVGQGYLKSSTASSTYAPLASPTFTGVPAAPTAAADTNTTQIATTAYVVGQGYAKAASPTFTGLITVSDAAAATIETLTDAATVAVDMSTGCNFTVTLGGNRALGNPTNATAGQSGSIFIVQDGTGSRTLSYGANWKFAGGTAPTLSTAASAVDRLDYIVRSSTNIQAVLTKAYA